MVSEWGQIFILDIAPPRPVPSVHGSSAPYPLPKGVLPCNLSGNARQDMFFGDDDGKRFLELLARSLEIYKVELLAFVLMSKSFSLCRKTPRANLNEFNV